MSSDSSVQSISKEEKIVTLAKELLSNSNARGKELEFPIEKLVKSSSAVVVSIFEGTYNLRLIEIERKPSKASHYLKNAEIIVHGMQMLNPKIDMSHLDATAIANGSIDGILDIFHLLDHVHVLLGLKRQDEVSTIHSFNAKDGLLESEVEESEWGHMSTIEPALTVEDESVGSIDAGEMVSPSDVTFAESVDLLDDDHIKIDADHSLDIINELLIRYDIIENNFNSIADFNNYFDMEESPKTATQVITRLYLSINPVAQETLGDEGYFARLEYDVAFAMICRDLERYQRKIPVETSKNNMKGLLQTMCSLDEYLQGTSVEKKDDIYSRCNSTDDVIEVQRAMSLTSSHGSMDDRPNKMNGNDIERSIEEKNCRVRPSSRRGNHKPEAANNDEVEINTDCTSPVKNILRGMSNLKDTFVKSDPAEFDNHSSNILDSHTGIDYPLKTSSTPLTKDKKRDFLNNEISESPSGVAGNRNNRTSKQLSGPRLKSTPLTKTAKKTKKKKSVDIKLTKHKPNLTGKRSGIITRKNLTGKRIGIVTRNKALHVNRGPSRAEINRRARNRINAGLDPLESQLHYVKMLGLTQNRFQLEQERYSYRQLSSKLKETALSGMKETVTREEEMEDLFRDHISRERKIMKETKAWAQSLKDDVLKEHSEYVSYLKKLKNARDKKDTNIEPCETAATSRAMANLDCDAVQFRNENRRMKVTPWNIPNISKNRMKPSKRRNEDVQKLYS